VTDVVRGVTIASMLGLRISLRHPRAGVGCRDVTGSGR